MEEPVWLLAVAYGAIALIAWLAALLRQRPVRYPGAVIGMAITGLFLVCWGLLVAFAMPEAKAAAMWLTFDGLGIAGLALLLRRRIVPVRGRP
jgi:hypothetical protein